MGKSKPLPILGVSPIILNSSSGPSSPFTSTNGKNVKCNETTKLLAERCPNGKLASKLLGPKTLPVVNLLESEQEPNMETQKKHTETESKHGNTQEPNMETLIISKETSKLTETLTHDRSIQSSSQGCLTQEQCELSSWGLPNSVLEQYKKIGITTMFEWQAQCLRTGNVLNGGI